MAFPAGLTIVTLTGQFDEFPSGGATGWVRFWYDSQLTSPVDLSTIPGIDVKVALDADGSFEVELPSTNDPGWSPAGFSYTVLAMVGARERRGTIQLDYADLSVRLEDLIQWDSAEVTPGTSYSSVGHVHTPQQVTERLSGLGEFVVARELASFHNPLQSGRLYLSHFTALSTETILTVDTRTGDQAASGTDNAWIGFMRWTGTQYTLDSVSVDDPTRWAVARTTYNSAVYRTDDAHFGAADLTRPGFSKVAGTDYVFFVLWNGDGTEPELNSGLIDPGWALVSPRSAVYIDLSAPPSSALMAEWVAGTAERFQGHMKR